MEQSVQNYFKSFCGKRVTFCGIGVSHRLLIQLFSQNGALVTACDKRDRQTLGEIADTLEQTGVTLHLGPDYLENLSGDCIFRTPGLHFNHPALVKAREQGIPVTSEMEEFLSLCPAPVYAVTGSDGKTTTTTIISELLKAAGKTVHLGGNIGTPLLPVIEEIRPEDAVVVELSSFQLMSFRKNGPLVSVVTNVSPNHLDVHKDMQEYIDAKKNVFLYQPQNGVTVLNAENEITAGFAGEVPGQCRFFSHLHPQNNGCYLQNGQIILAKDNRLITVMDASEIRLPGMHNVQNYMAAFAAVMDTVTPEQMKQVAVSFGGVEHRIEFVRELNGVKWYNDSIATSPTRAIAGLDSFDQKLIIIAGGYDKHIPFDPFAEKAITNIKLLILTGATADAIESCIRKQKNYDPESLTILRAENMEQAVALACQNACPGDVVSLSPACASFDRYPNFAERGRHFKSLVNDL